MSTDEILATCDIIDVEEKVKQLCLNKNLATEFVFSLRDPPPTVNRPNLRTSTVKRNYRILVKLPSRPVVDTLASPPPPPVNTTEDKKLAVVAPPPCPSANLVSDQFKGQKIEQLPDIKLTTEPDDQSRMPWPLGLNIPRQLEKDDCLLRKTSKECDTRDWS